MRTALLLDGPHRGLVHGLNDTPAGLPAVFRMEDCGHDQTCRYELAPGQRGRRTAAYRHLLAS